MPTSWAVNEHEEYGGKADGYADNHARGDGLQEIKTLWSPSYYVESIGHISEDTVRRYIEDQKETAQRKAGSLSSHG